MLPHACQPQVIVLTHGRVSEVLPGKSSAAEAAALLVMAHLGTKGRGARSNSLQRTDETPAGSEGEAKARGGSGRTQGLGTRQGGLQGPSAQE